jgi:hypothetical protein
LGEVTQFGNDPRRETHERGRETSINQEGRTFAEVRAKQVRLAGLAACQTKYPMALRMVFDLNFYASFPVVSEGIPDKVWVSEAILWVQRQTGVVVGSWGAFNLSNED